MRTTFVAGLGLKENKLPFHAAFAGLPDDAGAHIHAGEKSAAVGKRIQTNGVAEVERATVLYQRLNSWSALELDPTRRLGLSAFQRRFGLTPRTPEADIVGSRDALAAAVERPIARASGLRNRPSP